MIAGVPPLGAICGASSAADQATALPVEGSSENMVPPLLAAKSRGPSSRNCVPGEDDCQNRRVTLIDPDTVDWLFPPSLTVTDQATELLSPLGAEADARSAEM